jgi:hypothetical protein
MYDILTLIRLNEEAAGRSSDSRQTDPAGQRPADLDRGYVVVVRTAVCHRPRSCFLGKGLTILNNGRAAIHASAEAAHEVARAYRAYACPGDEISVERFTPENPQI